MVTVLSERYDPNSFGLQLNCFRNEKSDIYLYFKSTILFLFVFKKKTANYAIPHTCTYECACMYLHTSMPHSIHACLVRGSDVFTIKDIIFKLLCHMRRSHMQIDMAQHAVKYLSVAQTYVHMNICI